MTGELVPTGTASQIIAEGRALVRAIAAMNASAPTGHLALADSIASSRIQTPPARDHP